MNGASDRSIGIYAKKQMSKEWLLDCIRDHRKKLCLFEVVGGVPAPTAEGIISLFGSNPYRKTKRYLTVG